MSDYYSIKENYTERGLRGTMNLSLSHGKKGVITPSGKIIRPEDLKKESTETPEQKNNSRDGRDRDNNKIAASLNIAGLTSIAPSMNHSVIGGNSGFLGAQKPYITITQQPPIGTEDLDKYIGFPLEAKMSLNTITGYTEVSNIFLPNSASNTMLKDEEQEIRELLSGGVIF